MYKLFYLGVGEHSLDLLDIFTTKEEAFGNQQLLIAQGLTGTLVVYDEAH